MIKEPGDVAVADAQRKAPLLVADHLALDFLNTGPSDMRPEALSNGADLIYWLEQAGAIEPDATLWDEGELDRVAEEARRLRHWLQDLISRHGGRPSGTIAIAELEALNRLLAGDDSYVRLEPAAGGADGPFQTRRMRRWSAPGQLLLPLALAIADLVCHADFRLIRSCEGAGCTLVFLDRTKAHARRWCSMALCGNRAKAAAHRARRKASA